MKLLLLAFLLAHHPTPPPQGPGFCGEHAHFQCRQIGHAMSCSCVPND